MKLSSKQVNTRQASRFNGFLKHYFGGTQCIQSYLNDRTLSIGGHRITRTPALSRRSSALEFFLSWTKQKAPPSQIAISSAIQTKKVGGRKQLRGGGTLRGWRGILPIQTQQRRKLAKHAASQVCCIAWMMRERARPTFMILPTKVTRARARAKK